MEGIIKSVTIDPVSSASDDPETWTWVKVYFDVNALAKMYREAGYDLAAVKTSYIFNDEGFYENREITLQEAVETNHEVSSCAYITAAKDFD